MKLCECGCGSPALIATTTSTRDGWIKGYPIRFIKGHHSNGSNNPSWKGGRIAHSQGYVSVLRHGHSRADVNGYVLEHLFLAERALGRPLPMEAQVHHHNEIRNDNGPGNLVLCENQAYHLLLHKRKRAVSAGVPAHWLKCWICQVYDEPQRLWMMKAQTTVHRSCNLLYQKRRRAQ